MVNTDKTEQLQLKALEEDDPRSVSVNERSERNARLHEDLWNKL